MEEVSSPTVASVAAFELVSDGSSLGDSLVSSFAYNGAVENSVLRLLLL